MHTLLEKWLRPNKDTAITEEKERMKGYMRADGAEARRQNRKHEYARKSKIFKAWWLNT